MRWYVNYLLTGICWSCLSQTEAELARQNPGKMVSSTNSVVIPRLPVNPSRIDRLIVESYREHANVSFSMALVIANSDIIIFNLAYL